MQLSFLFQIRHSFQRFILHVKLKWERLKNHSLFSRLPTCSGRKKVYLILFFNSHTKVVGVRRQIGCIVNLGSACRGADEMFIFNFRHFPAASAAGLGCETTTLSLIVFAIQNKFIRFIFKKIFYLARYKHKTDNKKNRNVRWAQNDIGTWQKKSYYF